MKKGGSILGTGSFGCVSDIEYACDTQIPDKYNFFKPLVSKIILIPKLSKNINANLNDSSINLSQLYIKNNNYKNNNSSSNISTIKNNKNYNQTFNINSSVIIRNNNDEKYDGSVIIKNNNDLNGSVVYRNNKRKSPFEGIQFVQNIRLISNNNSSNNNSINSEELQSYSKFFDISNLRNEIENSLFILNKIKLELVIKHFVPVIHFCKFNINNDIINYPDYQYCVKNFIEKNIGLLQKNSNFSNIYKEYKRKILSKFQEVILFSPFAGNNLKNLSKNSNFFLQKNDIKNLLTGSLLLHNIQLIHHDIKLENISYHNNNILLLDFGESLIINRFLKKNNKLISEILKLSSSDSNIRIKSVIKNIIPNFVFGTPSYFPPEIIIFLLAQSHIDSSTISRNSLLKELEPYFKLNTKLNKNLESIIISNIDFIENILSSKENIIDFIKSYFQNIESNLYKFDSYCLGMSLLKLSKKDKIYNSSNIYTLIYNMMNPDIEKRYTINLSIQFLESIQ